MWLIGLELGIAALLLLVVGLAALAVLFLVVNGFVHEHMPELSDAARYGLAALCVLSSKLLAFRTYWLSATARLTL